MLTTRTGRSSSSSSSSTTDQPSTTTPSLPALSTTTTITAIRHSTTQTTPPLPTEVIHRILSYSTQGTLASACRTSKALYRIASPLLWKHLVLSPWKLDENGDEVLDEKGKKVLDENKKDCGGMKTRQKNGKALRNDVITSSLYHHSAEWCQSRARSTLQLPNLRTLHLHVTGTGSLHSSGYECRLLRVVKPQILVLHNAFIGGPNLKMWEVPKLSTNNIHTIFFISPADQALEPERRGFSLFPRVPKIKDIYWLFEPVEVDESNVLTSDIPMFHRQDYRDKIVELSLKFPNARLTIINAGIIQHYHKRCPKVPIEASEREAAQVVSRKLNGTLVGYDFWSPERKRQKVGSTTFVSFEKFIEKETWWKYLEVKEVMKWKKLMVAIHKKNSEDVEARKVAGGNATDKVTFI
ncbi:hypothetical protein I302_100413 [Kwoniella bestiolae CBS 10118]|uniref:F-box domain-containing protein n=1 Tax=Kwoniella bestiolae CBS 10118 TaxID=1296100 RepID=A0A1B9G525_9TREE|nr:hypothetical protein I302_03788 [Kwoniella bestiolae CBS 10118]OCF26111.1 hypothetical protein I302_03788 [Kwoniella bestiolae CBS 10118]